MLDAVSSIVIPRLISDKCDMRILQNVRRVDTLPEDIGCFAISALQNFWCQVEFIPFSFEGALPEAANVNACPGVGIGCPATSFRIRSGARPERRHPKVANLEPSLRSDKYIRRLDIQVDHSGIVDKAKTLENTNKTTSGQYDTRKH